MKISPFEEDRFIGKLPTLPDIRAAREGVELYRQYLVEGMFYVIIFNELTIALYHSMLPTNEVLPPAIDLPARKS